MPETPAVIRPSAIATPSLIVIGFMGGRVSSTNLLHREALLAKELQQKYPLEVHARMFANRDGHRALKAVLELLGAEHGSVLSDEKSAPRASSSSAIVGVPLKQSLWRIASTH